MIYCHETLKMKSSMLDGEASSTLFPCENCVSFWKEYCLPIRVFKVEKHSIWSKWAYSANLKKHMYLSKEKHLSYKQEHLACSLHVRIELVFERNTACLLGFSRVEMYIFFQKGLFRWMVETHDSFQRKTCRLECRASSSCFPWEVSEFFKGIFLLIRVFKGKKRSFVRNRPIQLNWKSTLTSEKKTIYVRRWNI
jgi:hypothetical protein